MTTTLKWVGITERGNHQLRESRAHRLPEPLKSRLESLCGMDLSEVQVYYNSSKPTQMGTWAYTEGHKIYLGLGQENWLPHHVWQVVQRKRNCADRTGSLKMKFN